MENLWSILFTNYEPCRPRIVGSLLIAVPYQSHIEDHVVHVKAQCLSDCCIRETDLLVSII